MPGDVVPRLRGFPERRYSPSRGRVRLRSGGSGAGCRRGAQSPGGTRVGRRRRLGGHSSPPSGLPEPHPPRHLPGWKSHRAATARLPLPRAKPPTGRLSFGRAADDNSSEKPRPSHRGLDARQARRSDWRKATPISGKRGLSGCPLRQSTSASRLRGRARLPLAGTSRARCRRPGNKGEGAAATQGRRPHPSPRPARALPPPGVPEWGRGVGCGGRPVKEGYWRAPG